MNISMAHQSGMRGSACLLIISAMFAWTSCASLSPPDINRAGDFTTTGFINENTLQVIVTAEADKTARGLVARRDSALKNAEARFTDLVTGSIADLRIGSCTKHPKGTTADSIRDGGLKKSLMDDALLLLEHGKRIAEYYREDESLVIVYRITKSGIKNDFLNLRCEARQSGPADGKGPGGL